MEIRPVGPRRAGEEEWLRRAFRDHSLDSRGDVPLEDAFQVKEECRSSARPGLLPRLQPVREQAAVIEKRDVAFRPVSRRFGRAQLGRQRGRRDLCPAGQGVAQDPLRCHSQVGKVKQAFRDRLGQLVTRQVRGELVVAAM